MSSDDDNRAFLVRMWVERRELLGLDAELRSVISVLDDDRRAHAIGVDGLHRQLDIVVADLARELGIVLPGEA